MPSDVPSEDWPFLAVERAACDRSGALPETASLKELLDAGDLVVTADIPLAAAVIEKQALALNPRGELYTRENIRERLSMRNFMDGLRSGGVNTGGPPALTNKDKQAFANQLDAWLAKSN